MIWVVRALGLWQFLDVDSIREPIHRRELAKMRDAFKEPHHAPELNAAIVSAREAVRAVYFRPRCAEADATFGAQCVHGKP